MIGFFFGKMLTHKANFHTPVPINTAVPINNLLALHKQYTDCPSNLAGYEAENLYKRLLFIRNIL